MRFSRRALIFSAAVPLVPSLVLAHACSLSEFESGATSTSSASTSASTSSPSSGSGGGGGDLSCPPEMVKIQVGSDGAFCVDRTEVTRGDYKAFLDAVGDKPSASVAGEDCAWNTSYTAAPLTPPSLPITNVDWCDAFDYCIAQNKRLCGSVKGGALATIDRDHTIGEWYVACSHANAQSYPYGNDYAAGRCNDCSLAVGCVANLAPDAATPDAHPPELADAGSFDGCVANGVYDLSGSVAEWEDACDDSGRGSDGGHTPATDDCPARGGSFRDTKGTENHLCCSYRDCGVHFNRSDRHDNVGFRCCKALK